LGGNNILVPTVCIYCFHLLCVPAGRYEKVVTTHCTFGVMTGQMLR